MPINAGRVGVRKNQVDPYGRIKLTDELKTEILDALTEEIVDAITEELGITYSDETTTSTKTIDGVEKTVKTTTRTYSFSGIVISEEIVEDDEVVEEGN